MIWFHVFVITLIVDLLRFGYVYLLLHYYRFIMIWFHVFFILLKIYYDLVPCIRYFVIRFITIWCRVFVIALLDLL